MNRFWKDIILPIIQKSNSKHIIELGCDSGKNTKNIIDYCMKNKAKVSVIDPLPKFDIEQWKEKYGKEVSFHKELSLNVLSLIKDYDTVLIDGDHNWYTVYNELKIIEKQSQMNIFPLVFLHDIGWPYGRRDLYYNPDNIPLGYRQPYKKLGMVPGQSSLVEEGGLNTHLNNGIYENNLRNGVLTAVEDFLSETKYDLAFIKINVFHGLGIIIDKQFEELIAYVNEVVNSGQLIEMVEIERIKEHIENLKLKKKIYRYREKLNKIINELD